MTQTNNANVVSAITASPPAAPGGRRRAFRIFVTLLAIAAAVGGGGYWLYARQYESTDDAFIEAHVVYIAPKVSGQVLRVLVEDNQIVRKGDLLVEIDPRDYEARVAQARGALAAAKSRRQGAGVNVDMTGVTSKAGVEGAGAAVEIAKSAFLAGKSQVSVAQSRLEQAKAAIRSAQAFVEQTKADVAASEAEANRTQLDVVRYRELFPSGSATRQQLDNAEAADLSAQAKLASARKKVASAEAQVAEAQAGEQTAAEGVHLAQAQLAQAESGVAQAVAHLAEMNITTQRVDFSTRQEESAGGDVGQLEGALRQAELQLEYTRIVAPEAGRVTRKAAEIGAYVQVGQAMMAIVPTEVWVVANFKETQLARMEANQPATVRVDAYPGRVFPAHVDSIQAGAGARFSLLPPENATGNYVKVVQRVPVKIVLDSPPGELPLMGPGMSAVPQVKVR
jgi:membrane fusion protein, multidrug efflux system